MRKANYTRDDLKKALNKIGINKGDNIFLHSNIGFFGQMEGVKSADELCENFISVLKECVGETGTIVLPTFSYSFCHGEIFNPEKAKSDCGMLTDYAYAKSDFIRSLDPNFSIAAWGDNAIYYTDNPTNESFGRGCFWERFLSTDGKIIFFNMDCSATFIHYVEKVCNVSYRYNKAFNGTVELPNGECYRDYAVHFVTDGGINGYCGDALNQKCRKAGIVNKVELGKGTAMAIRAQEFYDLIVDTLKKEPKFLTLGGNSANG